jgi:hypothetical protein
LFKSFHPNASAHKPANIPKIHHQTPLHVFTDHFPLSVGRLYESIENSSTTYEIRYIFASSTSNNKQNQSNQHYSIPDLNRNVKEIYTIVEKHFLETLVRFHRETEGAPYTGLKPAGTTKIIVQMSDQAIATGSADDMINKLNAHIDKVIR